MKLYYLPKTYHHKKPQNCVIVFIYCNNKYMQILQQQDLAISISTYQFYYLKYCNIWEQP